MTEAQVKKLREILLHLRNRLKGNVNSLQHDALHQSGSGTSSSMPIHMADLGSDNFEQELSLGLMENEADQLREVEDAIGRIDDGTYGICEQCNGKIKKARLTALPFVRNCIDCQRESETNQ